VYAAESEGTYKAFGKFKTENAFLRFGAVGAFTEIKAEAGVNRALQPLNTRYLPSIDLSVARTSDTGSSFDLKLQRKITNPSEQFGLIAGSSIGVGGATGAGTGAFDINNTLSLYDSRLVRLSYKTKRRRTEVQLGLSYRKEDTLDGSPRIEHRRIEGVDAMYHRIWGSKTGIVLYGSYEIHHGELYEGREDRELALGAEFAKPLGGPGLRWVLTIEHRDRTSSDSLNDYHELRIGAYLRYSKFIYNRQVN